MEPIKMNFFEQIFYAVAKPKQYYKLTKVSGGRLTAFVFLLVLIATLFTTAIPFIDAFTGSDGVFRVLDEKLPYFEMKGGSLYVAERYELYDDNVYVLIDTNVEKFSYSDIAQNYEQAILISRTNYIQRQPLGRTQEFDFKYFREYDFNKDIIQKFKPFVYIIMVVVVIIIYLFGVGAYFFTGLLYSLVGLFVSSVSNANLPYGKIFKTAIYSKVTIKLLYTFIGIFDPSMPGGIKNIIAIIVTCAYVVYGILSHNSDEANSDNEFRINQNNNYNDTNNYYDNSNNFPS